VSQREAHAKALFAPLGPTYDRVGALLSFGQDPRWRRSLVAKVPRSGGTVLDVATGTGLVAAGLLERGLRVTGVDQSPEMLERARARLGDRVHLVEASANRLPFADASFDHLTFTYLLRYVDDPAATLRELARVVRTGGVVAMLEFGLPGGVWRLPWSLWVDVGLPLAGRLLSPGWQEVGRFLGGSIRDFHARYPEPALLGLWRDAGIVDVRSTRLSLGGGLIVWGRRDGSA
jgi:demethylmenaquinone methyltransferase / 2-methoxy-6-polyprenyl-1,4-benzoquinol methylase